MSSVVKDQDQDFLEEWGQVVEESAKCEEEAASPELTPAKKLNELARAYADARESGEDGSKALLEKYRELNPPEGAEA